MKTLRWVCVWGLVCLGALLASSSAMAAEGDGLDTVLDGLNWGDSTDKVLAHFKAKLEAKFDERKSATRDPLEKERMRRQMLGDFERIKESHKKFTPGGRTGYEVSVISGEFGRNSGESVIVFRDEFAMKYYLFANGKFWKLVISYHSDYIDGISFDAFVGRVATKYGSPVESDMSRAVWNDKRTEMRIEDKSDLFSTFAMVFSHLETAERLAHVRRAFGAEEKEEGVSSLIEDIQEDDSFAVNEDIVDSLVGDATEVDLERGMRADREVKRVDFAEKAAEADADAAEPDKKAKPASRRPRRGRSGAKPAAKPKSKDLIIY